MTWLLDRTADDEFAALLALSPQSGAHLAAAHDLLWTMVDPVLLELARLRMAQLLGCERELRLRYRPAITAGLSAEKIEQLAAWPASPLFSGEERACLAFTEQYLMDVKDVSDEMADDVRKHLGESGLFAFTNGLAMFEAVTRMSLALEVSPRAESVAVVERLPRMPDPTREGSAA